MLQDNLSFFLEACQQLGLKGSQLFSLEDLQPSATGPYRNKGCVAGPFVLVGHRTVHGWVLLYLLMI